MLPATNPGDSPLLPPPAACRRQHVLHPKEGAEGGRGAEAEQGEPVPVVRVQRTRSGRVHEYPALAGDIHPAQISKAFRCG